MSDETEMRNPPVFPGKKPGVRAGLGLTPPLFFVERNFKDETYLEFLPGKFAAMQTLRSRQRSSDRFVEDRNLPELTEKG